MIGIKVITVVNMEVADILTKPTACKYEIVNFLGNLIWCVLCYSTALLMWKPKVQHRLTAAIEEFVESKSVVVHCKIFNHSQSFSIKHFQVRNFKTQKVCRSTLLDPTTSCFFLNILLFFCQMQNSFFVLLTLQTPLAYDHS